MIDNRIFRPSRVVVLVWMGAAICSGVTGWGLGLFLVWSVVQGPEAEASETPSQAPFEPAAQITKEGTDNSGVIESGLVEAAITPAAAGAELPDQASGDPTSTRPQLPEIAAPRIIWVDSPNFNNRPAPADIGAIVIHATAGRSLAGVIAWFRNPASRVSAHYSVDKDGVIVQHVRDQHRAWHAGVSAWRGRPNLNDWSIGIELVNLNNGQDPYSEAQHRAVVHLIAYLCRKYDISPELVIGHRDVAPQRKTDPLGYDFERLRLEVQARLDKVR